MSAGPSPPVSPENIARAPIDVPGGAETNAQRERDALAHERAVFERELGVVGKLFGGKQEKSGNIAVFVIVLCFVLIGFAYLAQLWIALPARDAVAKIDPPMPFERIFTALASIITLVLGYLFGSNDRSER